MRKTWNVRDQTKEELEKLPRYRDWETLKMQKNW